MRFAKSGLLMLMIFFTEAGFAQNDTLIQKSDSLPIKKDSISFINNINPQAQLTFKTYFILLGSSLKQEFAKPFHMNKKDWGNFGKFAAVTVALSFADEPIQQSALKLKNRNTGINKISKYVTNFGGLYEGYTLAALGAYGFIFENEKMKTTTLLATQALVTGAALEIVLKFALGRTRPSYYGAGVEAEPKFLGPFSKIANDGSFPSGHTTVAFAAATVFASEYKNKPLIPIIAYSAATLVGISRITENKHWATDVFVGAAVGFLSGKNVVKNYHAKLKGDGKQTNSVSFNLNYASGHWEPGLIYKIN